MKLRPVSKLTRETWQHQKILTMKSCRLIVTAVFFFQVYGQIAAIWKPDSGRIVYKTYIFINNNLYRTKTEIRAKNL